MRTFQSEERSPLQPRSTWFRAIFNCSSSSIVPWPGTLVRYDPWEEYEKARHEPRLEKPSPIAELQDVVRAFGTEAEAAFIEAWCTRWGVLGAEPPRFFEEERRLGMPIPWNEILLAYRELGVTDEEENLFRTLETAAVLPGGKAATTPLFDEWLRLQHSMVERLEVFKAKARNLVSIVDSLHALEHSKDAVSKGEVRDAIASLSEILQHGMHQTIELLPDGTLCATWHFDSLLACLAMMIFTDAQNRDRTWSRCDECGTIEAMRLQYAQKYCSKECRAAAAYRSKKARRQAAARTRKAK